VAQVTYQDADVTYQGALLALGDGPPLGGQIVGPTSIDILDGHTTVEILTTDGSAAMDRLAWKEGDTSQLQQLRLRGRDGDPVVLAGATVVMHADGTTIPCDIVDGPGGIIRPGRGGLTAGGRMRRRSYRVEFEVTFAGGIIQTFPERGYEQLTVHAQLDPEVPEAEPSVFADTFEEAF